MQLSKGHFPSVGWKAFRAPKDLHFPQELGEKEYKEVIEHLQTLCLPQFGDFFLKIQVSSEESAKRRKYY